MDKKSILITGASGLVGSHLVSKLSNQYDIYALVRSINTENSSMSEQANPQYIACNFENHINTEIFPEKIDAIIHLMQSNLMREFPNNAVAIFDVNVKSTALLLDYGRKAGATHFIFASTGGIYGSSTEPFDEDARVNIQTGELSYYFRSKYASENLVKAYSDYMAVHILRPFFIYGKKQKSTMLLPRLVTNIRNNIPITLQGKDGIVINPVHVSDVVQLIEKCLHRNTSLTINVAGPDRLSIRELSDTIGELIQINPIYLQIEGSNDCILAKNDLMREIIQGPLMRFKEGVLDII
jgi:nucleoside-diphosphate-sugar epimerase